MFTVRIDRTNQQLVAKDPLNVQSIRGNLRLDFAPGDAGPDERTIVSQGLHGLEGDLRRTGGINNQVGFSDLFGQFQQRGCEVATYLASKPATISHLRCGPGARARV